MIKQILKYLFKPFLRSLDYKLIRSDYHNLSYTETLSENFSSDKVLANNILEFISTIDPFYKNMKLPKELLIRGEWGADLNERRKEQLQVYESKDLNEIAKHHENMFFNDLMHGMDHYVDMFHGKQIPNEAIQDFSIDLMSFKKIY